MTEDEVPVMPRDSADYERQVDEAFRLTPTPAPAFPSHVSETLAKIITKGWLDHYPNEYDRAGLPIPLMLRLHGMRKERPVLRICPWKTDQILGWPVEIPPQMSEVTILPGNMQMAKELYGRRWMVIEKVRESDEILNMFWGWGRMLYDQGRVSRMQDKHYQDRGSIQ